MRVAFCGASGTGKTVLAQYLQTELRLEANPIGSRSVALAMGFASPYEVDKAGKRLEFQGRLLRAKVQWETEHDSFVTDRTTLDNLIYTLMHSKTATSPTYVEESFKGALKYDLIFFNPLSVFHDCANDPARKSDLAYHEEYETLLLQQVSLAGLTIIPLTMPDLEERKRFVLGKCRDLYG